MPHDGPGDLTPPNKSSGDHGHLVLRMGLSAVPLVGGPAVELLNAVLAPPLERRRDHWMEEVAQRLKDLEAKTGVPLEELAKNDVFVDTVLHATHIALRTSQQEKLQALRNAVANAATSSANAVTQHMFLEWIDRFSDWHLLALRTLRDHSKGRLGGTLPAVLSAALRQIGTDQALYNQVWADLHSAGLVKTKGQGRVWGLTDLGTRFLRFIESPA